jgi:hypothetical protein
MVPTRTVSTDAEGKRSETRGHEWRPRLAPSQLRELRRKWAVLLYHHRKPTAVRVPIAARKWRMRAAVIEWSGASLPRPVARPLSTRPDEPATWPEVRPRVIHVEEPPAASTPGASANGGAEVEG